MVDGCRAAASACTLVGELMLLLRPMSPPILLFSLSGEPDIPGPNGERCLVEWVSLGWMTLGSDAEERDVQAASGSLYGKNSRRVNRAGRSSGGDEARGGCHAEAEGSSAMRPPVTGAPWA